MQEFGLNRVRRPSAQEKALSSLCGNHLIEIYRHLQKAFGTNSRSRPSTQAGGGEFRWPSGAGTSTGAASADVGVAAAVQSASADIGGATSTRTAAIATLTRTDRAPREFRPAGCALDVRMPARRRRGRPGSRSMPAIGAKQRIVRGNGCESTSGGHRHTVLTVTARNGQDGHKGHRGYYGSRGALNGTR